MMITLCVPENKHAFDVDGEIAEARNIKDKLTRESTLCGLNKIRLYI